MCSRNSTACQDSAKKFGDLAPSDLVVLKHPARTAPAAAASARRHRQRDASRPLDGSAEPSQLSPASSVSSPGETSDSSSGSAFDYIATVQLEGDICTQASIEQWLQSKTLSVFVRGVRFGFGASAEEKSVLALDIRGSRHRVEASLEALRRRCPHVNVEVVEDIHPVDASPVAAEGLPGATVVGCDCYHPPRDGVKETAVHLRFCGDVISSRFFSGAMVLLQAHTQRAGIGSYFLPNFLKIAENPYDTSSLEFCLFGRKPAVTAAWQELMALAMDLAEDANISSYMDQRVPSKLLRA